MSCSLGTSSSGRGPPTSMRCSWLRSGSRPRPSSPPSPPESATPTLGRIPDAGGAPAPRGAEVLPGRAPAGTFDGKIVLVGATALGLGDLVATPLDKAGKQPGVTVHANALNTILTERYLEYEPIPMTVLLVFGIGL